MGRIESYQFYYWTLWYIVVNALNDIAFAAQGFFFSFKYMKIVVKSHRMKFLKNICFLLFFENSGLKKIYSKSF